MSLNYLKQQIIDFQKVWFPESKQPEFWFGAQKIKNLTLIQELEIQFGGLPEYILKNFKLVNQLSNNQKVLVSIILDQLPRSFKILNHITSNEENKIKSDQTASTTAALLIISFLNYEFKCKNSVIELCFLTLVLRHTRDEKMSKLAEITLNRILIGDIRFPKIKNQFEERICQTFLHQTQLSIKREKVNQWIHQALNYIQPNELTTFENLNPHVLDLRALKSCNQDTSKFLDNISETINHSTILEFEQSLIQNKIDSNTFLVVSLSGGVDSMSHAVMLKLLQPKFNYGLMALHLHHPNRYDSDDEKNWVTMAAQKIGIPLYGFKFDIQRPHGDLDTGITRERYEEVTKEIRFKMYDNLINNYGTSFDKQYVVIGHHLDDIDENRLAELGKSNIIDIDGVETMCNYYGVTVYRPLLHLRKESMFSYADEAQIPYMVDSTPKWSRRGWTRRFLDQLEIVTKNNLLTHLNQLGNLSTQLGKILFQEVSKINIKIQDINNDSQEKNPVLYLGLNQFPIEVDILFTEINELIQKVKIIWNKKIEVGDLELDLESCPIQKINIDLNPKQFIYNYLIKRCVLFPEVKKFLHQEINIGKSIKNLFNGLQQRKNTELPLWGVLNHNFKYVWFPKLNGLVILNSNIKLGQKKVFHQECIRVFG
jgi:tRNA(Ile)-lysidine synthetase-like protein